VEVKNFRRALI